jgi:hypothetical protein
MYRMPRKKEWGGGLSRSALIMAAICCLWLACAGSAHADLSMQLTGLPSTTSGGYYVGTYQVTVNGTPMNLICDDFTKEITQGETWTATLLSGTQIGSMKFANAASYGNGATTATQAYQEVFWLSSQLVNPANSSSVGAIHFAIWTVLDPAVTGAPTGDGAASTAYWLNLAGQSQNYSSVVMSNYQVYAPNPFNSSQEFIGVNQSPVPLPPSVMLMGTGLIGVVGLRKRLKRRPA